MTQTTFRKEDLLYFAGILDGEGSISLLGEYGRSLALICVVGSTSRVLIDWLQDTFGGIVTTDSMRGLSKKPFWRWQVRGDAAAHLLQTVQPLLKIKGDLARVGCEGWMHRQPTSGRANVSADALAIRRQYYMEMRRLNGRLPQEAPRMPDAPLRWQPVTLHCAVCGAEFRRRKSHIKRSGRAICESAECLKQWKRQSVRRALAVRWGHDPE